MYDNLDHLSEYELNELIEQYYNSTSEKEVKKIIDDYELNIKPQNLWRYFPPEIIEDEFCEFCGTNLKVVRFNRKVRKTLDLEYLRSEYYCPICGHQPHNKYKECTCPNCIVIKEKNIELKKEKIKATYDVDYLPIKINELELRDRVSLGALCFSLLEEDMYHLGMIHDYNGKITPTKELLTVILKTLANANIIRVSALSDINAFVQGEKFPNEYYIYLVKYYLGIEFDENKRITYQKLIEPEINIIQNIDQIILLWENIAIQECIEYLLYKLDAIDFQFSPGAKTLEIFSNLVFDFSVSQIFGIIKRATEQTLTYYYENRDRISKKHAANIVINNCQKYAERAKINNWNLYQYNRPKELLQSDLSFFFFYKVLKIGDKGFRMSIKEYLLNYAPVENNNQNNELANNNLENQNILN